MLKRSDYQTPQFLVPNVQLNFLLHPTQTRVQIVFKYEILQPKIDSLVLNTHRSVKLVETLLDGVHSPHTQFDQETETLTFQNLPKHGTISITSEINPLENLSLSGLYMSQGVFCTQNEPQGFRNIIPFFDRPDVLSKYSVTLKAPADYPILLSNGHLVKRTELPDGSYEVQFDDPFPKPCYLFALVGGKLDVLKDFYTTMSGRKVLLEFYTEPGQAERCQFALNALKRSMHWDEQRFQLECDLDEYRVVAMSHFNGGAMENKGLNIFNSKLVLGNDEISTDPELERIDSVIAHEYFHNWTGNRVTLRDWFELSLKEGLTVFRDQEYSSDTGDRNIQRLSDIMNLQSRQFAEDASPNAHPVRPFEVMSVDNFFTPTIYEKGAEVIRMLQTILGKAHFDKGFAHYITTYDGQAVSIDEWLKSFEAVSKKDLSHFKKWYETPGTPIVTSQCRYDSTAQSWQITLEQSGVAEVLDIPIEAAVIELQSNTNTSALYVELLRLDQKKQTFVVAGSQDATVSLLRGLSAPVILKKEPLSKAQSQLLFAKETDGFALYQELESQLLHYIQQPAEHSPLVDQLLELLRRQDLSEHFRAQLVPWPTYAQLIAHGFTPLDFTQLNLQKQQFFGSLGRDLLKDYDAVHGKKRNQGFDKESAGRRALQNKLLQLGCATQHPDWIARAETQYFEDQNLTDRIQALQALLAYAPGVAQKALMNFKDTKASNEPLLLQTYFGLAARLQDSSVFDTIENLQRLKEFDPTLPNHHYAVWGNFSSANPAYFYHNSGKGFQLLATAIKEIDNKNPQVSARLSGFFEWTPYLPNNSKHLAIESLKALSQLKDLSVNAREIIEPTLKKTMSGFG